MKWTLAANLATIVCGILGIGEIPVLEGKVNFTDDQKQQLAKRLEAESDVDEAINAFNRDLAKMETDAQREARLNSELKTALQEAGHTEEEVDAKIAEGDVPGQIAALNASNKLMKQQIDKLINESEPDAPLAIVPSPGKKAMHSATHLWGDNKAYNAFAGRPWNQRAAGIVTDATEFSDKVIVEKLNDDLDHYFRENPETIKSLHRDNFGLPSFWPKRFNVDDKVSDGNIVSAPITQARKLPWLPKNKQMIQAEEGQIFPVQIDIEFIGYYLQKMEASWLNKWNKEGSQPYKESFVMFLVSELDKKARVEDRISTVKGIHVATPEDATTPGKFINRQDGLLYQLYKGRFITKKFKPFAVGTPTTSNIVDYVDKMIESLDLDVRVMPNLVFYISPYWIKAYKRRYEQIHGTQNNYTGYPVNPKDYSNVQFEVMPDLEGLDVMFITFDDNIELLENIPKEKSLYHFEYLKRIMYIWADYKQGIRLIHVGNKIKDGDPLEFKVQSVWTNDVPIFKSDVNIPLFDDATGTIKAKYGYMKVDAAWATPITHIEGAQPGQIIKLEGNTNMAASKNVNSTGNLTLTATFDLKSGGILTLFVKNDGTITELSRTAGPPAVAADEDVNFDGDTIDASNGSVFRFTGAASDVLEAILKGVEGDSVTIYGNAAAGVTLTVSDVAGNIDVTANAVLALAADYVTLVNVGGVWYESERDIA
ncbi:hypothetical protein [Maribacter sp. Hel_I_7]|uniref:hypothetical protein n=1 Tax=Maribacter sp. Hel_I_7 TaxID=1249997 RepID=UPI00047B2690|nr:hypothetical protein [Maribacter sp. Hel_I_7]